MLVTMHDDIEITSVKKFPLRYDDPSELLKILYKLNKDVGGVKKQQLLGISYQEIRSYLPESNL